MEEAHGAGQGDVAGFEDQHFPADTAQPGDPADGIRSPAIDHDLVLSARQGLLTEEKADALSQRGIVEPLQRLARIEMRLGLEEEARIEAMAEIGLQRRDCRSLHPAMAVVRAANRARSARSRGWLRTSVPRCVTEPGTAASHQAAAVRPRSTTLGSATSPSQNGASMPPAQCEAPRPMAGRRSTTVT